MRVTAVGAGDGIVGVESADHADRDRFLADSLAHGAGHGRGQEQVIKLLFKLTRLQHFAKHAQKQFWILPSAIDRREPDFDS